MNGIIALCIISIVAVGCASPEHQQKIMAWEKFRQENECRLYQDEFTVPGVGGTSRSNGPVFICKGKLYQRPF